MPAVAASASERAVALPGDELVSGPGLVVMDRAFSLPAPPAEVWPWLVQLGKGRAGWYLPTSTERLVPRSRRAARVLLPAYQSLAVGDVVPDWGGTFTVALLSPGSHLVHTSVRGRIALSWCLALAPNGAGSRVHLRLRMAPVRRRWLAEYGGGLVDWLTVVGLAAGLRERVTPR